MEKQCTKCKSRDVIVSKQKTSKGTIIEVLYCKRCKEETRAVFVAHGEK